MGTAGPTHARAALAFGAGGFFLLYFGHLELGVIQPAIQADLALTHAEALWVVDAFMLGLAVLVPHGGRLTEIIGPRRTIFIGLGAMALGALGAALAGGYGLLVASLALQGAGAGIAIAPTISLVVAAYPAEDRGRAVGRYVGLGVLALPIAPLVAGALVQTGEWRLTFWLYLALTLAVLVVGVLWLPSRPPRGGRVDALGGALAFAGLALVLTGAIEASTWGWSSPATLVVLAAGVALLPVFVLVELHTEQPLVDLTLLRNRVLGGAAGGLFLTQLATSGVAVFVPIYLLTIVGLDALETGLAMLPAMAFPPALAPIVGTLVDRHGCRGLAIVGALLAAAGCTWLALFARDEQYAVLIPGMVLFGVGIPLAFPAIITAGANAARPGERGESAGVLNTARWVGATVGTVSFGAILDAVRDADLDSHLSERTLNEGHHAALDRLVLSDEDAASIVVHGLGADVLDAVTNAFAAGYSAGLWLCAGAFAGVAVVAAVAFRAGERPASGAPHDH